MKITKDQALETLKEAYEQTVKRNVGEWQPIKSTKLQLEYCLGSLLHKNDRRRLKDIMFYQYAVHEFEADDPEYAELLHKAAEVVDQMIMNQL